MPLATVLIEDSQTIRDSLVPALTEIADANVIAVAETATEGLAALARHADSWRLVVLDMLLKEGNGLDVLRARRERRSDQHIVVLTSYATANIRQKALEAGADAVFDKSTELDPFFDLCKRYQDQLSTDER